MPSINGPIEQYASKINEVISLKDATATAAVNSGDPADMLRAMEASNNYRTVMDFTAAMVKMIRDQEASILSKMP